ncbi:PP2C family serine/threonine-protein phosphatase [Desulfopila sp. IMCC35008]|uniref:PP2C family protein-serine/threonine phosphatase n=1 Tax=Desulfopila sp. IMCC35008 TaxID=2653858 RepID=UPI0013D3FB5D|nr:protein phosphatase 2C domain-containing protein [Desulfopila sp. IMCC35008]
MNQTIEACCKTDTGLVREKNEDVCYADTQQHCYLVADGMGGQAGGEIASSLFRQATDEVFGDTSPTALDSAIARLQSCFNLAHKKIHQQVVEKPELIGMGCTADLLTFYEDHYLLGHVGDSRTYLYSGNALSQLTTDHSLLHEQISQGVIASEDAEKSRFRNVLLQAVGVDMQIDVDIITGQVEPGSQFLLCSDGLYTMVREEELISVLAYDAPPQLKAEILINMANDNGGRDNIAITLIEVK